jgi:hypothetical protein
VVNRAHRKKIPIQGTGIVLDSPEALEKWVEERKRRWPTAERTEDKKRKLEEAVARGELVAEETAFKKRRFQDRGNAGRGRGGDRGGMQRGGRGRGRGRGGQHNGPPRPRVSTQETDHSQPQKASKDAAQTSAVAQKLVNHDSSDSDSSSSEDSDGAPEVVSSKTPMQSGLPAAINESEPDEDEPEKAPLQPVKKAFQRQPKGPAHNPFERPSLLQNVGPFVSGWPANES